MSATTVSGLRVRRSRIRPRPLLWHVMVVALLLLLLYPVAWLISTSFKPAEEALSSLSFLPTDPTSENYDDVLGGVAGYSIWTYLKNSLVLSGGAVIGNVVACSLAAYAFARMRFRFRGVFFAFMIATIMLPHHVTLIPQYILFQKMGLINTIWPIVVPKLLATDAFFVFLLVQFIRGLPRELEEAATIDGAGPFRTFRYIIVPLLRPALITTAIFTFIWTWNDFLSQLIYLNDPSTYTMPLALRIFIDQTSESAYGSMFAMSVLAVLPIGLFFLAFQRYLVEGVATKGLK
jgi:multiple sugar transport system permease protein